MVYDSSHTQVDYFLEIPFVAVIIGERIYFYFENNIAIKSKIQSVMTRECLVGFTAKRANESNLLPSIIR